MVRGRRPGTGWAIAGGAAAIGVGYLVKRLPDVVRVVRATHTLINIEVSSVLQPKDE